MLDWTTCGIIMMDKAFRRRKSGPPCVSYPLWPVGKGPVRIIVDAPTQTTRRASRWARRGSESVVVLSKVVRRGKAFCRSLTPEPRLSGSESPEPESWHGSAFGYGPAPRAKSLSPAKRTSKVNGFFNGSGDRSLGSTDDELDESPPSLSRCQLLVEDEDGIRVSPSPSPRHSLSSAGSAASQGSTRGDGGSSKKQDQGGVGGGLAKLARLLMQKAPGERSPSASSTLLSPPGPASSTSSVFDPATGFPGVPSTPLRRSASIDSLLDATAAAQHQASCLAANGQADEASFQTTPTSGLVPRPGALPNSPSVPSRLAKGVPALFAAVEHHHIERARSILETSDVDVNSVNTDGFTALDVAVLTGEASLARLLQSRGASESPRFPTSEARANQLSALLREAHRCVDDLAGCVASASANQGSLSNALLKEKERQLSLWKRRLELISEMKAGFDELRPPDPPSRVTLEVVGTQSLRVRFSEPPLAAVQARAFVTKYRVEWCEREDFSQGVGSRELTDVQFLEYVIRDLEKGTPYHVRVAAGNAKGFSAYQTSWPLCARPSSWRDGEDCSPRWTGRIDRLDSLFLQVMESRPLHGGSEMQKMNTSAAMGTATALGGSGELCDTTPMQQRRQMRKSIRQLFAAAPKFQRTLKRGVYLACLFYNEDRILVTTEETLPILEVDDCYPASFQTDFHWLMKVACTWDDVKTLRLDMEKSHSSSNVHFRSKLLQTVEQMQSALGVQDLGQVYYKPLRDYEGTAVVCVVKYVSEPKTVSALSVRWIPLAKIQRRMPSVSDGGELPSASELLVSSIQEMITYNQTSSKPLPRGLYLGYLKLKSSMDLISVLVPYRNPNVLPHCRIRDNPHVSREEWQWLKSLGNLGQSPPSGDELRADDGSLGTPDIEASSERRPQSDESQLRFQRAVSAAARSLFTQLEVPPELYDAHRLYDAEVVELAEGVSFLLVLPAVESVCSVPGQRDELTSRADCLALPVQVFEVVHLSTYQAPLIARYARVSAMLETDTVLAQHANREAFSAPEVAAARSRLTQLQDFQAQLEQTWRGMRWIMDALSFARDRSLNGGLPMSAVWTTPGSTAPSPTSSSPTRRRQTQPTIMPPATMSAQARRASRVDDLIDAKLFLSVGGVSVAGAPGGAPVEIRRCASASRLVLERPQDDMDDIEETSSNEGRGVPTGNVSFDINDEDEYDEESAEDILTSSTAMAPSVLRVYAAYESGLPPGTSIKLHVTPETTAREVVELVVRQLNTAVVAKGRTGPLYGDERLADFCLVAVVGSRERCLSADFQPLRLQNPWTKGRLFVRLRNSDET
ncbi:ankyrin repeat and fibronectin type III domain containing protein wide awake isoform X2 [Rhipicephalus microplus]|uniref:ankyrin repeat and fibronectin type III domain containing protein wide awake isoform X2 n=1 Tax=Rhipicephalus microplus TaxID=6941 RepID=UPI003F6B006D